MDVAPLPQLLTLLNTVYTACNAYTAVLLKQLKSKFLPKHAYDMALISVSALEQKVG